MDITTLFRKRPFRLLREGYQILWYDLFFEPDGQSGDVLTETNIGIEVRASGVVAFVLDACDLPLEFVECQHLQSGRLLEVALIEDFRKGVIQINACDEAGFPPGKYRLFFPYTLIGYCDSHLFSLRGELGQTHFADRFFPCDIRSESSAEFCIDLALRPGQHIVAPNFQLVTEEEVEMCTPADGIKRVEWGVTRRCIRKEPIHPNDICVLAGDIILPQVSSDPRCHRLN